MPKKEMLDDGIISEHGNWNVAADYAKLKIMKQLYLADQYETIATFGFSDFISELSALSEDISIDVLKIRGFKRLIKSLMMVIDNSYFAMKGNYKIDIKDYRDLLVRYWKVVPKLFTYKRNEKKRNRELKIDYKLYEIALEKVIDIKTKINIPLNRHDLIFTYREPFDPKKAKQQIKERLTNRG